MLFSGRGKTGTHSRESDGRGDGGGRGGGIEAKRQADRKGRVVKRKTNGHIWPSLYSRCYNIIIPGVITYDATL